MGKYKNALFEKVRNHQVAFGFSINYPNPSVIENITQGWDYIWLDAQHGQMDYGLLLNCMIATDASNIGSIIRVQGHDFSVMGPVADLNPSAIMVPMVNNKIEAQEISANLHFPPKGHRSFWNTRMINRVGNEYYKDQDLMVIAQIETAEAVDCCEEIINTDGIDVLMFGPADLGLSYGIRPGTTRHDNALIMEATNKVIETSHAAGKYCMFIAGTPEDAKELYNMQVDIIVSGSDHDFLYNGAQRMISELDSLR